ncbi:MAG: hypothetical protein ACLFTR_01605 [Candidatus Woesearchaeota archaeon]
MTKAAKDKNSKMVDLINSRYIVMAVLAMFLIIIALAYNSWGLDRDEFPGAESNYNLRLAESLKENDWDIDELREDTEDNYSADENRRGMNLGIILLSFLIDNTLLIKLLNVLLVGLVIFLAHTFMKINHMTKFESNCTLILIISSPAIIFFSLVVSPVVIYSLLLLTAGIALKRDMRLIGIMASVLMPFFGIPHAVIFMMVAMIYLKAIEKFDKIYYVLIPTLVSGIIIEYLWIHFSVFNVFFYSLAGILNRTIAEFGSMYGIGIMTIVLSMIGFVMTFVERRQQIYQLALLITIGSIIFVDYRLIFLLNLMLSAYGAHGFSALVKRRWYSEDLKKLTILVIICGLLFTQLSYFPRITEIEPTREKTEALRWLEGQEDGIVLTTQGFSPFIQKLADKPTVLNHFTINPQKMEDIKEMFSSRNLTRTRDLMNNYDIEYIYLDDDIEKKIWLHSEDGLLFLFRDQHTFHKIYEGESGTRIYRFIHQFP